MDSQSDVCIKSHSGIEYAIKLAKDNIFWPGMMKQEGEAVISCGICARHAASQQKLPMMSHQISSHPWQILSIDLWFPNFEMFNYC